MPEDSRQAGTEIEITPQMIEVVRCWMDNPENRDSIEMGAYGDDEQLIRKLLQAGLLDQNPLR